MAKVQLIIDRDFRDLCSSSSSDELGLLESSIKTDGCREAIYYWANGENEILDGHQRFTICTRLKKTFEPRPINLPNRAACEVWILRNQLCRRNLTDAQRSIARGKLYNRLKSKPGGDRKSSAQNEHLNGRVAEKIAEMDGVGASTVRREGDVAKAVEMLPQPIAKAIEQGDIPMKHAVPLAELPKKDQAKAAKAIASGEAKSVQDAIQPKDPTAKPTPELTAEGKSRLKAAEKGLTAWRSLSDCLEKLGTSTEHKDSMDNLHASLKAEERKSKRMVA